MFDEDVRPTKAYDLLKPVEKNAVDDYLRFVVQNQRSRRERVALALNQPIPQVFMRRSRGLLMTPICRAALAERIQEESDKQDISPSRVISEYAAIAYANPIDFYETGHFGDIQLKDLRTIPAEKWSAVKAVESKPTPMGLSTRLIMHDKREALAMLAKLMGLVAPDAPPPLEDYVTDQRQRDALDAPEAEYAALLEG